MIVDIGVDEVSISSDISVDDAAIYCWYIGVNKVG